MNRVRTALCIAVLVIPFCLLFAAASARITLARPWTTWQPPITEPWLSGAKAPPPELVARTWFGENLHDPTVVLARTQAWGTIAAGTLVGVGLLLLLVGRFRELPARPSALTVPISGAARFLLRLWPFFGALYAVELIAVCYFFEVLINGGITFITPALAVMILFGTTALHLRIWRSPDPGLPPRLNAKLLNRSSQPKLVTELDSAALAVAHAHAWQAAAMLEPQFTLAVGPIYCSGELVDGYLPLIALPLLHCLTVEEFRALAGHMLVPLAWAGGLHADRIQSVHEASASLCRRVAGAFQEAPFGRLSAMSPGVGFSLLALQPAEGQQRRIADLISECDRIAAARFGSRDLARALLKQHVMAAVWPGFRVAMAEDLKAFQIGAAPHPYALIAARLAASLRAEHVKAALAEAPPELIERMVRLGYSELPEIDCVPPESAADLLVGAEALDSELSVSERAYFVFERPRWKTGQE